jgi:hypothetical protein
LTRVNLASDVWVSSITGDDNSNGLAPDTPVKSFAKARMISQKQMQPTVIHLDGTFYETMMQPIGWALARRNINRTLPPPTAKSKL